MIDTKKAEQRLVKELSELNGLPTDHWNASVEDPCWSRTGGRPITKCRYYFTGVNNLVLSVEDDLEKKKDRKDFIDLDITPIGELSDEVYQILFSRLNLKNLDVLKKFKNLKRLLFFDCTFENIAVMENLSALWELSIRRCSTNDDTPLDLSPLAKPKNLQRLSITETAVANLQALSECVGLMQLDLRDTGVKDLSPLAALVNLESLCASLNPITDVTPVAGLERLTYLNLWETDIVDFSCIKNPKILCVEKSKRPKSTAVKKKTPVPKMLERIKKKLAEWETKIAEDEDYECYNLGMNPVLPIEKVKEFERKYKIKLPKEYVAFITEVCDGFAELKPLHECGIDEECIAKPFDFTEYWVWENRDENDLPRLDGETDDEYEARWEQRVGDACGNGQIKLTGKRNESWRDYYLIVTGPSKGQVWNICGEGMYPYTTDNDERALTFLEWVEKYLNEEIDDGMFD